MRFNTSCEYKAELSSTNLKKEKEQLYCKNNSRKTSILCNNLENNFLNNDPNLDRALNCMFGHYECMALKKSATQSLKTNYIAKEIK